jgi:anti-sigma B factor antagonist
VECDGWEETVGVVGRVAMWKKFDLSTDSRDVGGKPVQIVRVEGYLDSSTFPQLQEHLSGLIAKKNYRFVIDLQELNYISSAGLGVLMGMLQEVREHNGDLKVANMSVKIRNLFDMLGFSRLVRIYEDVDKAVKAFAEEMAVPSTGEEAPEDSY